MSASVSASALTAAAVAAGFKDKEATSALLGLPETCQASQRCCNELTNYYTAICARCYKSGYRRNYYSKLPTAVICLRP